MFTHVHRLLLSKSLSVHLPSRSGVDTAKAPGTPKLWTKYDPQGNALNRAIFFSKKWKISLGRSWPSEELGTHPVLWMHRNLGITNLQQSFAASYIRSVHVFSYMANFFSKWLCNFNLIHKPLKWIEKNNNTNLNNSWPIRTYEKPYLPCIPSASAALPGSSTACYARSSGFRTITADCRR